MNNRIKSRQDQVNFLTELKNLLEKYNTQITADDHWEGYAECGQDIKMTIDCSYEVQDIEMSYIDVDFITEEINKLNRNLIEVEADIYE